MILSTTLIEALGFVNTSEKISYRRLQWEKEGFVISSEEGINGGGFNLDGHPLNTLQQLQNNYLLKTGKIL